MAEVNIEVIEPQKEAEIEVIEPGEESEEEIESWREPLLELVQSQEIVLQEFRSLSSRVSESLILVPTLLETNQRLTNQLETLSQRLADSQTQIVLPEVKETLPSDTLPPEEKESALPEEIVEGLPTEEKPRPKRRGI